MKRILLGITQLCAGIYLTVTTQVLADTQLKQGVIAETLYTTEWVANLDGGISRGSRLLKNLDLTLAIDTSAANWWQDGHLFTYLLAVSGGTPSEMVGDMQTSSNIESASAFRLYEFWYQHQLNPNNSILFGLHDYNSVFNTLDHAGLFLNSSFGISPDISQVTPSIFPQTSPGLIFTSRINERLTLHLAAYDGITGDGISEQGTKIKLDRDDGIFYAAELQLFNNEQNYNKLALGTWFKTTDFNDDITGQRHSNNSGIYLIGEYNISQDLGVFFQVGSTDASRNIIDDYFGFGINHSNIFLPDDQIGLAIAIARISNDFIRQNTSTESNETAIELSYILPITSWLTIQPDIQYIKNPGANADIDNALVFAFRAQLTF